LSKTLQDAGYDFEILRSGLTVRGSDAATIGSITTRAGVALTTLQQRGPTLEDVFLDLVHDRYVPPTPTPVVEETALFDLPDVDAPEPVTAVPVAAVPVAAEPAEAEPVEAESAEPEPV